MHRTLVVLVALAAAVAGTAPTASSADAAQAERVRLRQAVRDLPVAREVRRGYDRDKFEHWVDADDDCRDTRDEVLAQESRTQVSGCDIVRGEWFSYYDAQVVRRSSELDVDHLVALAEAWDSGARRWTAGTRLRFANDLGDRRSLVAVTASTNRSKSDRDPAEWLPDRAQCRYVGEWVAVKARWSLTVDRVEKRALVRRASNCRNRVLTIRRAVVRLR
jgi:hypothetical protein